MSSLRFASFGAATVPLSKIVVDKDLNMGPYAIKGVYRPEEWATETLDWGDVAPSPAVYLETDADYIRVPENATEHPIMSWTTPAGAAYRWTLNLVSLNSGVDYINVNIKANGAIIDGIVLYRGTTVNRAIHPPSSATVTVTADNNSSQGGGYVTTASYYQCTGIVTGPKTFNLSGRWLALGIDMHGLDATVKIHGVEVPYSDYAKYFPLAPTELKIPGNWSPTQERPVIKVYKGI